MLVIESLIPKRCKKKTMKETLFSFSDSEIYCQYVAKVKYVDERRRHFGMVIVSAFFVVYDLPYYFTS